MPNAVPSRVSQLRAKALRQLIAQKNETFRRGMIGRQLNILVLEPGAALSTNFIRVRVPKDFASNAWVRVQVTGLDGDGLAASKITTAHDTN